MAKYISFVLVFSTIFVWNLTAQDPTAVLPKNVFENLSEKDSLSAKINFYQDKRIEQLFIDRQMLSKGEEVSGFRVQVFSSNVQQTAKSEAFRIKALVEETFPDIGVYESYSSPFWKVRVGDCYTREEAQELLAELKKDFPSLRREMYIVPDKITVGGFR